MNKLKLKIIIDNDSKDTILIEQSTLQSLSLIPSTYRILSFGKWQKTVQIKTHESSHDIHHPILLSANLVEATNIPLDLTYEFQVKEQTLEIGPVIGILISGKKENVTERQLRGYRSYIGSYALINGLVVIFTYDAINWVERTVDGFAFNPDTEMWRDGIYPFPSAFYSKKDIDKEMHSQLVQMVGKHFFNSYTFSKWEMWEWLSQNKETKAFLPESVVYNSQNALTEMLDKHNKVFIKPIWGMRGLGIYQLERIDTEFHLQYRLDEDNEREIFYDEEEVSKYLYEQTRRRKYLIQQYIPLLKIDARKLDVRVIMQKAFNGIWELQGMVTRFGPKDSIVSNISRGGYAELTWKTLLTIFDNDQAKVYSKWKEIEEAALQICHQLEKSGFLYGNLGLDIGIDELGNLWLIEINNRYPDPTIAFDADDAGLYYQIRSNPLKYAKCLAGFEGGSL